MTQGDTKQSKAHEGILHRIPFGNKETGEVNQKIRGIPEISIQIKGNIQSPREVYTNIISASAFSIL